MQLVGVEQGMIILRRAGAGIRSPSTSMGVGSGPEAAVETDGGAAGAGVGATEAVGFALDAGGAAALETWSTGSSSAEVPAAGAKDGSRAGALPLPRGRPRFRGVPAGGELAADASGGRDECTRGGVGCCARRAIPLVRLGMNSNLGRGRSRL